MRKACSGWSKQHITLKELVVGVLRILEAVLVVVGTKAAAWKAWAEAEARSRSGRSRLKT
jgi:hypothetical protein